MDFKQFCDFLEDVKQTKTSTEKFQSFRNQFKTLRESGTNIFSVVRLILPNLDRERDSYNMKEAKVARTLIKMLDLPPGNDKTVLSKSFMMSGQAVDFADVVYSVIRKYLSNYKTTLSLQELNTYLDDLSKRKNEAEAEEILMKLFKKSSPENIKNGFDYTDNLGESFEKGILTPKLKGVLTDNTFKIILDGEMMLWDNRKQTFGSKGMTLDVKKLNAQGPYQPCFCAYDIILLNNKILTDKPLNERVELLRKVFKNLKPGVITLSEIKEVFSRQEIVDELNAAVNKEDEGIVVKDPNSIYKYSDRNSGWYKLKLEYFEDAMNDLDLIVMGGQYASSTSDKLNSFVVGIRSGSASNGKPLYLALGKVSSGLSDSDLDALNKKIKSKGVNFEKFSSQTLSFGREVPNIYIEPEHSLIFQVRATELIRTTDNSFKSPYTLRFPRVLQIRYDKPVDECLTINELLDLTKSNKSVIKLNKRNIDLEEILKAKVRKIKRRDIIMPTILDDDKVSDILEGYTILVLNGSEQCDKEKVENLVKKAGGTVSYRLNDKVDIVLVGTYNERVKEIVSQKNKFDVINVNWLQRLIEDGNILGYDEEEVYSLGCNYKSSLSDELDVYGDSFTAETTVEKLKKVFHNISTMKEFSNQNNMISLRSKNFGDEVAYFDKYLQINDQHSNNIYKSFIDELEFRYYCGEVSNEINEAVTMIIYEKAERKKIIDDYLASINRGDIKTVSKSFIYE
ncbi:hypothetical protein NQ315_010008 [Exocentrus adspersus]|uniref:DNA ligase IV n=1 Tax=Exocentrus adspersus TaxID=1586481 RepID=A0AAV8VK35_9CUCU|nr:hypothetical protein NQ315_010008 [Exocentrus adspersus]